MWFKCCLIWFEDHQHSLRVHRKEEICLHPSYSHLGNVFGKLNFLFLVFSPVSPLFESYLLKYTFSCFNNCKRIEKLLFYLPDIFGCEFKHRVRVESFSHLKRENKKIEKSLNLTMLTILCRQYWRRLKYMLIFKSDNSHPFDKTARENCKVPPMSEQRQGSQPGRQWKNKRKMFEHFWNLLKSCFLILWTFRSLSGIFPSTASRLLRRPINVNLM